MAAYAVCMREGRVLLSHLVAQRGLPPCWTMPGGGIDHGEDPLDAVVREVAEETGYTFVPTRLIGIDSECKPWGDGRSAHSLRIVYTGEITGGQLRDEVDGSTDRARWFALDEISALDRVSLVDTALALHRSLPATGSPRRVESRHSYDAQRIPAR